MRTFRRRRRPDRLPATDADLGIAPPFTMGRDWERGVEYGILFGRLKDYIDVTIGQPRYGC